MIEVIGSYKEASIVTITIRMSLHEAAKLHRAAETYRGNETLWHLGQVLKPYACQHDRVTLDSGEIAGLNGKDQEYTPKCSDCGQRITLRIKRMTNG